ncbi:PREDICTED: phosphatidylcholine transfer protein-like [Bison bison bison]|uniref:Phosphatidylcholine transfer protein n=1 Tax=Bison bison bison TaxID=43346 RepID=A0A6P3IH53_BISBB|nr:PREDICTED: phosphatidylcholine transfer protein-like [Bison bison bison]
MASASRFSEEEFQKACAELQHLQVSGWELPVVTSVVKVYQRPLKKLTGLHEYKVSGIVRSPPDLLADVYMDLEYRKQWDQYVQELHEIKVDGEEAVYWQMKYPFPMSNRDCVYVRQRRELNFEGRKVHVILAQSISVPWFSEKSGMIRVKQYKQSLAIQSYDSWRSEVFMYYFNNPGGQIPFWILNNFTKVRSQKAAGEVCLADVNLACSAVGLDRCAVSGLTQLV